MRTIVVSTILVVPMLLLQSALAQDLNKANRYLCYVVDTISTSADIKPVEVRDQFGRGKATILKPRYVCNPVDIDGKGIADRLTHITCYEARTPIKPRGPLVISNDFERARPAELSVKEAHLVCVASTKKIGK
jgi:hypothetical protein